MLEVNFNLVLLVGAFAAVAVCETLRPRRRLTQPTGKRWFANALLFISNQSLFVWLVPVSAVIAAADARAAGTGLVDQDWIPVPAQAVVAVLALDFSRYLAHRLLHAVPPLWRIHQVHHSDVDVDLATGLRHHPLEALFSAGVYIPVVWLLGAPPAAVAGYEAFSLFHLLFSHANIAISQRMDAPLRRLLITPDMHRVHHSIRVDESQRNYGLTFPFWDRVFGTYQADSADGQEEMKLGVEGVQDARALNVLRIFAWPFRDGSMRGTNAKE